jgi:ligand-binding SRPBCC domain-containing protein
MQLFINADQLKIELTPMEQFWAVHLSKTITVPLTQIRQVTTDVPITNGQEIRAPGTSLPGVIKAGTYYQDRRRSFWYVQPKKPVLTLELRLDAYYQKIVLALDDNLDWLARIQGVLAPTSH